MLFLVTQGHVNLGMIVSWSNALVSDILVDNSTLLGNQIAFAPWEMDMTGSLLFIGTATTFPFAGWLVAKAGRRRPMMLTCVPGVIGWVFCGLASDQKLVLVGRYFLGVSGAILGAAVRTYLVEVADTGIRGAASMLPEIMKGLGAIAIIAAGMLMPWYFLAFMCGAQFLFYSCLIVPFLPESPTYLAVTGEEEEARQVLRRLRGPAVRLDKEIQKLKEENRRSSNDSSIWAIFSDSQVVKRILIITGIFFITNFSGSEVIRVNATRMLQESGLAMDGEKSTIVVFSVLLCGNIAGFFLFDRLGRRWSVAFSLFLVVISHAAMGVYVYFDEAVHVFTTVDVVSLESGNVTSHLNKYLTGQSIRTEDFTWVPLACLMLAAFSANLGAAPAPWILSVEYFPTSIRSQVMGVSTMIGNLISFAALQAYSPMQAAFTQAGLYWSYASVAALGIVYTFCFVQETKGRRVG
ncbi:facilitated trehalose transporter Tret1-like [Penaeus monodon]|uniref:facilitated trehalose transporter Tret1-like n=1 Tax=Penaeus monodon TaxID=6687 RepID=UPI0018A7D364|nr:facilitated trehalose transporter Tret1-like [Penaeus monodon]